MKIGMVLDDTLDTPDGVQQYVLSIGGWLSRQGHDVQYLVGSTARTDVAKVHSLSRNLRVTYNGNRMSMPLPANRRRLRALLRSEHFDVLHVQVPYSPFMAGRILGLAPAGTAVVGTFHILPYGRVERLSNHLLALLNRRTGRRFQAMIAASEPAAEFARNCYGFDAQVIPHPFDYQAFAVPPASSTTLNIVYMARLVERKGCIWLLRAVTELRRRQALPTGTQIRIGGRGPLLASLESFVDMHKLRDIVWFDGFIAETEKASYLAAADIAVFPSTSGESFGISIIEALAASRGVVLAGDNPGYRAAMPAVDQFVDPPQTAAFADILERWLADAAGRSEAAALQKTYAKQFAVDAIAEQVLAVYERALQNRTLS